MVGGSETDYLLLRGDRNYNHEGIGDVDILQCPNSYSSPRYYM